MAQGRSANGRRNAATAGVLFAFVGGMVGLAYAAVPLYELFCQVTGYGGTPQIAENRTAPDAVSDRFITVRFDANVNNGLGWNFKPQQREVRVRLGETALAFYTAKNTSDIPVTGTATYNVTPYKAAPFFGKVDCFCFTEQLLEPGQEVDMPVSFYVDPDIFAEANTQDVNTITLSYTFYPVRAEARAITTQDNPETRPQG